MDRNDPNKFIVFKHWHSDDRADAADFNRFDHSGMTLGIGLRRCEVGYLNRPLGSRNSLKGPTRCGLGQTASARLGKSRWYIVRRHETKSACLMEIEGAEFGTADAYGFLQHACKNRLKIAGRAADNLKYLRGGCALNLLPSIATLGCVSSPIVRHSAIKRAHTLRMAPPLSLRKTAIVL